MRSLAPLSIIVIYPELVDSKDAFIIRHCLRDSDRRRARQGASDGKEHRGHLCLLLDSFEYGTQQDGCSPRRLGSGAGVLGSAVMCC